MVVQIKTKLQSKSIKLLAIFSVVSGLVVATAGIVTAASANTATFSLSPSSGTYKLGDTLSVKITEDSGSEEVIAAEADLNYDPAVLQFVSVDTTQSAFNLEGPITAGGGVVMIPRAVSGGSVTGSKVVASVNFKVIASVNFSDISFASSSEIDRYSDIQDIWNHAVTVSTYAFASTSTTGGTAPPTTTPSTKPPAGSTATKPSGSSSGSAAITKPAPQSAGTSTSSLIATTSNPDIPQVLVIDSHLVAINVTDKDGKPIKGAKVSLGKRSVTTGPDGSASFNRVASGKYQVNIRYRGDVSNHEVIVKNPPSISNDLQKFTAKLDNVSAQPLWILYVSLGVLMVAALAFLISRRGGGLTPPTGLDDFDKGGIVVGENTPSGPTSASPVSTPNASPPPNVITPDARVNKEGRP